MENKTRIDDRILVSRNTANWVYLRQDLSDLYAKVTDALEEEFGVEYVDGIMDRDFNKAFFKLMKIFDDKVTTAVFDSLSTKRNFKRPLIL